MGDRDNVGRDVERIVGGAGDDDLTGNEVANRLTGGAGVDALTGLERNDEFFSRGDGSADDLSCGAGAKDRVTGDAFDTFPTAGPDGCEIINVDSTQQRPNVIVLMSDDQAAASQSVMTHTNELSATRARRSPTASSAGRCAAPRGRRS